MRGQCLIPMSIFQYHWAHRKKKKNVGVKIAPWFPANYITYIKPVLCELCTLGFKKRETLKINEK